MSSPEKISEDESLEIEDDKDLDFDINDYVNESSNEDSFGELPEDDNYDEAEGGNNIEIEEEFGSEPISITPEGHRFDRKFVCIKYPGNVINPDKAIRTLGGLGAISTAVDTPNRRLELRFRPDDEYSKPACGDRLSTTAFLLSVKVKKSRVKKVQESVQRSAKDILTECIGNKINDVSLNDRDVKSGQSDAPNDPEDIEKDNVLSDLAKQIQNCNVSTQSNAECSSKVSSNELGKSTSDTLLDNDKNSIKGKKNIAPTFDRNKYEDLSQDKEYELPKLKILGTVDTEFQFTSLCDFQYLPITQSKKDPKVLECIYNKIYPIGIPPYKWMKNKVPYFLPPAAFSRVDSVQQYVPKTEISSLPENIIGKNIKRRAGFTNFICFNTQGVPTKPPPGIEIAMKVKFLQHTHLEKIRQMFEERPIWSKNAIMYNTRFTSEQLKILLPSVAYYFMTGPWRIMWIRLGYDPRKDTTARKYQTLDYRLKAMRGLGSTVKCKRNYSEYMLPYKSAPAAKPKMTVLTTNLSMEPNQSKETKLNENMYIYKEGMVPPSRQMFYQYCDILVDEVQQMLAKLPDPMPGARCHEKRGWLPSGFDVQCREIINKQVRAVLRKQLNIPEDHPTTLPRKRKWGMSQRINRLMKKKIKMSNEPSTSAARIQSCSESSEGKDNVGSN